MPLVTLSDPALPPALRGPVLIDARGRLRYWPLVESHLLHGKLKPATATLQLRAIERLYRFADQLWRDDSLDRVVSRTDLARIDDFLHAYFSKLRREAYQTGHPSEDAWRIACRFSVGACERLLIAGPPQGLVAARALLDRLGRFDHQLALRSRQRRRGQARGLPAVVLEELYELVLPDSPRNPFRSEPVRWRNFVLVLLLLHQGLRRSEALLLPVDCVKTERVPRTGVQRFWLNVCENPFERSDPRPDRPDLKNQDATRQVPISEALADAIQAFVENHRGRRDRSYLFCFRIGPAFASRTAAWCSPRRCSSLPPRD